MSATNSTSNYELPIFLATDKPAWLTDWNGAMNAIDTAIHSAQSTADGAQTTAGTAVADIATINASLTTITGNINSLTTTVNGNTGAINTINSLIGNGQPTTEDKTLIGAINEIYAMIGGGTEVDADIVAYDNTSSGLTATNVQDAIDELATAPTQDYDFNLSAHTGVFTVNSSAGTIGSNITPSYALNADKSIGKIMGGIDITALTLQTGWTVIASLTSSDMPTRTTEKSIDLGFALANLSSGVESRAIRMKLKTDGSIDIEAYTAAGSTILEMSVTLPACVYFISQGI